jgi:K+-sensing histidine kinase KdpD
MLVIFTLTFGVPLAGGSVSLLPMVTVAAYLALGLVSAGWIAFAGAVIHGLVRHRFAEQLDSRRSPDLLGLVQFVFAAVTLVVSSLVIRNLARSRQRLERRVKELDSLQAVGQALSASLLTIKFTPDRGHIRLWATLDPTPSTDRILIGVSDTGPGIPLEAHSQVFEKLQQIHFGPRPARGHRTGAPFLQVGR